MSALFKRKDKTTIAELEEYYANQRKRRSSTAWLMALLSLLITAAVIVGLFFGGRWLYRTLTNDDTTPTDTTTTTDETQLPTFDSDSSGEQGVSFEEGTSNNPDDLIIVEGGTVQSGNTTDSTADSDGRVDSGAAVTTESNEDRLAGNQDASSAVGGIATETPNTGPGETVALILVTTVISGYVASRTYYANKR